jgi:hypothetical protein
MVGKSRIVAGIRDDEQRMFPAGRQADAPLAATGYVVMAGEAVVGFEAKIAGFIDLQECERSRASMRG